MRVKSAVFADNPQEVNVTAQRRHFWNLFSELGWKLCLGVFRINPLYVSRNSARWGTLAGIAGPAKPSEVELQHKRENWK